MRVRFTIRRLMILIVVVAFAGVGARWAMSMRERSQEHLRTANHEDLEREVDQILSKAPWNSEVERETAKLSAERHALLRDRAKEAASRPWLKGPNGE